MNKGLSVDKTACISWTWLGWTYIKEVTISLSSYHSIYGNIILSNVIMLQVWARACHLFIPVNSMCQRFTAYHSVFIYLYSSICLNPLFINIHPLMILFINLQTIFFQISEFVKKKHLLRYFSQRYAWISVF